MSKKVFLATGVIAIIGGLSTAVAVSSCDQVCTMEAKPSVVVRFYDATGAEYTEGAATSVQWWHITDPTLVGSAPDPAVQPPVAELQNAECMDDECTAWIAGWETEGEIEIRATMCGHEFIERIEVPMDEYGCHVETQEVNFNLGATDCAPDDVAVPPTGELGTHCTPAPHYSVIVNTVTAIDGAYVPAQPSSVYGFYRPDGTAGNEAISGLCLDEKCTKHAVGIEQAGPFDIKVEACGAEFTDTVTVGKTEDGCHVDTEVITIFVDPDKCVAPDPVPTLDVAPVPKVCDLMAVPSAIVYTAKQVDDYFAPIPVDEVWGIHSGERVKGLCVEANPDDRGCTQWVVGYELAGEMTVSAAHCGKEASADIRIDETEDGCHVITEYVTLEPDTTGCLAGEADPVRPKEPPTPGEER